MKIYDLLDNVNIPKATLSALVVLTEHDNVNVNIIELMELCNILRSEYEDNGKYTFIINENETLMRKGDAFNNITVSSTNLEYKDWASSNVSVKGVDLPNHEILMLILRRIVLDNSVLAENQK